MDDLISEFIAETRETLEGIADALLAWEADPSETARLDEIFRFVHTVKGSCGFLNLARIEALAHAAETILGTLRSGSRQASRPLVGAMLRVIDRIALLVEALDTDAEFPPIESDHAIIAALEKPETLFDEDAVEQAAKAPKSRNVRVTVDLLDTMMNEVSDLVLVRNELARAVKTSRGDTPAEAALERLSHCVADLRDSVARARMQPVERLFAALPRLVRDTAGALGKSVELLIEGGDVELDREMVEQLRDPLVHMVRNAIDHGVEFESERVAAGKPARATLRVSACQSGNQIAITIEDDGRGLSLERLRNRAVEAGMFETRQAASLDDAAAANLIFAPGLSTSASVTAISGRGVGMDVVRTNIERLGGTIALDNRPHKGLAIELRAPLTLSIVTVLSLRAAGQVFAVPRAAIDEVFSLGNANVRIEAVGSGRIATIRGEALPVVVLGDFIADGATEPTHLIVIDSGNGHRWALATESIGDHQEVVVRPVAPIVAASGLFAGQALPDDGSPLLVLDVLGLARLARIEAADLKQAAAPIEATSQVALITFVTITGEARAVRAALVERVADMPRDAFTAIGEHLIVTDEGVVYSGIADAPIPDHPTIPMLRLSDGMTTIGLVVGEVCDLVRVDREAVTATPGGDMVLIDGKPTPLVDGHALFAATERPASAEQQSVAIIGGDPRWAAAILEPLLTAAGYRVAKPGEQAGTVLCIDAADYQSTGEQCVIRLGDGAALGDDSHIDRYDRDAILAALSPEKRRQRGRQ